MTDSPLTRRGRPRDPLIDERVLGAARELLATKGMAGTTIQAIARLAEVRPNAIYRRWSTRIELIEEAIFPGFDTVAFHPTGKLEADLHRLVAAYRAVLAKPEVLASVPFLLSRKDGREGGQLAENRALRSIRPLFRAILSAASDELVDRSVDPDDAFDLMLGGIFMRTQLLAVGVRTNSQDRIVRLICRILYPTHDHQDSGGPGDIVQKPLI
jgi:AcrR family transcriptional regulator